MAVSKKLAALTKKFQCLFCDGECALEYYLTEASSEEIAGLLALWKVCTPHAQEISDSLTKKEAEKATA